MAKFTLTDLQKQVSKKYAPTIVENGSDSFELRNILQMPKEDRKAIQDLNDSGSEEETTEDMADRFKQMMVLAEANGRGEELFELIGDNVALILELFTTWSKGDELGEA